ncbi:MAG: phosphoribosyltransferase family protein [Bacteroidota bacterium]
MKQQLLNHQEIKQKVLRMAYEIYEQNFEAEKLYLIGVRDTGYILAELLCEELRKIVPFPVELRAISLDKQRPTQSRVNLEGELDEFKNQRLVLVDDVLNTGRTLAYSFKPFLEIPIQRLQTAVLVNREHHSFPIAADFSGYELSTTLQEHIEVKLEGEDFGVFLK